MRPRVVLHNVVSLDGRIDGIEPDLGRFYGLAQRWREDVTLAGSGTLVAGTPPDKGAPSPPPAEGPLLAAVDSLGRVRGWGNLLASGLWRGGVSFVTDATPAEHLAYLKERNVEALPCGAGRVDLRRALDLLGARYGARTVRVESGGGLAAILLREGLVDEVSLVIEPRLVGGDARPLWRALALPTPTKLRLATVEALGDGTAWLRYERPREAQTSRRG